VAVALRELAMPKLDEDAVTHLEMIQGVINRLASSSATMKGLAGTIAAGAIALYGTVGSSQWVFLAAASLPVVIFWILDSKYLRIERAFRHIYELIRKPTTGSEVEPFSMDYKLFLGKVDCLPKIMLSWSTMWFYVSILVAFACIYIGTLTKCTAPGPGA